jgi:hypothetical protein
VKAAGKDDLAQLRDALGELAAADAAEVVAEARAAARVKARALIEEALVEELVRAAAVQSKPPVAAATRPDTTPRSADGHAVWLYGVVRSADAAVLPPALAGVEPGARVEILREGDLAALTSPVPRDEYADERLREHLNDIEWVERTARAHQDVLETALVSGVGVVPFRLCTLYREPEGVHALLRDEGETLRRSLAVVDGRAEWGMKLFVDRERLAEALAAEEALDDEDDGLREGGGEGTDYLVRKQQGRAAQRRVDEFAARCAEEVHRRLETMAERARITPVQPREAHGREADMLLNGVYLVSRREEGQLEQTLRALRADWDDAGFQFELTGPWPPYNFVSTSMPVTP